MDRLERWLLELTERVLEAEDGNDAAHDLDHIVRTMAIAKRIQAIEGGNLPTLLAAVALHDIGQEREKRTGRDHALVGAEMAEELLTGTDFPAAAIPGVRQAIREHRTTGSSLPATLEGRILFDADKIDSLGAVGITRLYCITGMNGQRVYAPVPETVEQPISSRELIELRKRRSYSSGIEFEVLLADLPDKFLTPTGRAMALERHDYMRGFFDRLRREVEGEL